MALNLLEIGAMSPWPERTRPRRAYDVPSGVRALADLDIRMVTLSNGSAAIARRLLTDAGVDGAFEAFLSVEQAGIWKPAHDAYAYALQPARSNRAMRCWWRCTRGTPMGPVAPA
jgi:FMN phosphatase YigB (HAD superfamily)